MSDGGRETLSALIVFFDFTYFDRQAQRVTDDEIADTLDAHYHRMSLAIRGAGGRVIKFMGDGALAMFPIGSADAAVQAIRRIIEAEDRAMAGKGWECRLQARVHAGNVVAGEFGAGADRRYDIFGRAVNATARLKPLGAVTLTADAYSKLSPELRRQFVPRDATVYVSA